MLERLLASAHVGAGALGANGSEILLGPPFVFNKSNINNFDF